MNDSSGLASFAIILACTFAILSFTMFWSMANRRPVAVHARLTGRRASPYWYSPTGLQDERGITEGRAARVGSATR